MIKLQDFVLTFSDPAIRRKLRYVLAAYEFYYRVEILPGGKVKYLLYTDWREFYQCQQSNKRVREASFTKFINWVLHKFPGTKEYNLTAPEIQIVQDALINWAAATFDFSKYEFEIVEGAALVQAYRTGPTSCMSSRPSQLNIYVQNPDKVKLLKIKEDGKYIGRALLWYADDGSIFLDRIYPGNGRLAAAVRGYATAQGWGFPTSDSVGSSSNKAVKVTLKHSTNGKLAYFDNLRFLIDVNTETFTITNNAENLDANDYTFVGDVYSGHSPLYYRSVRTLDGTYYPAQFENGRLIRSTTPGTIQVKVKRTVLEVRLRKGEKVYKVPGIDDYLVMRDTLREINGLFYRKSDTRKVRNQDAYVPKANAVAFKQVEAKQSYDGQIIILKEVENVVA